MSALQVIVVAFHGAADLARCLDGLEQIAPVVVVDNSTDAEVRAVAAQYNATYLCADLNRGFASGVNAGLRVTPPTADVLLLNPDAVIRPASVAALHEALYADRRLAAVSPRLVDETGAAQRTGWPFPTPSRMLAEALGVRRGGRDEFVVGAALMLRREAIDDVGGFDETFFLYAEETDWQRRAARRGWRIATVERAEAQHRGAGTSIDSHRREALFHAGTETYVRKWFGARGWASYRAAAVIGASIRSLVGATSARRAARARVGLFLRGPRNVAGLD